MDAPISPFVAFGIVFGAMLLALGVVYIRHVRYEHELEREEEGKKAASR